MIIETVNAYGVCLYKKHKNTHYILLCKSVLSKNKWGLLKGVQEEFENNKQTAIREFFEESSIKINAKKLGNYYYEENEDKNIGIYMSNAKFVKSLDTYFIDDILKEEYLCKENSQVKFFDILDLPPIKKKQVNIIKNIVKDINH